MARRTAKSSADGGSTTAGAGSAADGAPTAPARSPRKRTPKAAPTEGGAKKSPRAKNPATKLGATGADAPAKAAAPAPTRDASKFEHQPSLAELMFSSSAADVERLSMNFAEAVARANTMISATLQQPLAPASMPPMDPFGAQSAVSQAMTTLVSQPQTLANAQADLWMRYASIWQEHAARWVTGASGKPASDKRFRDPEWTDNPYFSLLRDTYLATSDWLTTLVDRADGLDDATRRKASFLLKQAADAAAPPNFLLTNPAALRATLQSKGENLVQGVQNFADDLARGHGTLAISQTDLNAFRVGENIAATPGKVVFRNDVFELLQYTPTTESVFTTPLLIFPPWINKFYILDLQEKNSFIRWLVQQGHTVFVVSWVNPDAKLAEATFEDYIRDGVFAATDAVYRATGERRTNAVGYCIGGTLLASALAYMAEIDDDRIKSATFFAAQTDFKLAGELLVFTDEAGINYVEKLMDASGGFLDSQVMADTFNALRSNDLVWSYVIGNYYMGRRPPPFDLLFWNADQTRMPRALHLFYLKRFYGDNALSRGELTILGKKLSLKNVKTPVYMQSSKEDHIAPAASVYRSARLFGGPVRYLLAGSGHIAGVINPPDANKYQHWLNSALPETLEEWLDGAEETPGSWWNDWHEWLAERAGSMIAARQPGDGELSILGDAPGDYVRVKSKE